MSNPVIELTQALIRCASITPQDAGCQAIIAERLTRIGFQCEFMRFGDVDNLWATYGNTGPLFVFAGHTDVVPTGPLEDWHTPPFTPDTRDGYLYGRGASDMKSAIAAMVIATEQFIAAQKTVTGTIGFLLTSDEEGPSINGTKKVIETLTARGIQINYCVIGEPSSDQHLGDQIRVGRRGSLHGKLTVHGKQGHVAHPHLAENPIHSSSIALHQLTQTEWDQGNDHFPPTTFQISNIHSGTGAANVIPGHLESLFNFRYSTAVTVAALQERTEALLRQHDLKFDINWQSGAEPFLSCRGTLITATETAIQAITNRQTKLSTGGGTSDGRFIAPTGAETIELGVSHATAHHTNECVRIEDLHTLTTIYQKILDLLLT